MAAQVGRLAGPRGHEAVGAPAPVHHGGVDECGQHEGVRQVGRECAPLSDGALNQAKRRGRAIDRETRQRV